MRVAELNRVVRQSLETLGELWVEGEVLDFTRSAAGHLYFTLGDENEAAQARCVMFRSDAMRAGAKLGPGAKVRVRARPTLYEQRGAFQLVVTRAMLAGEGDLAAKLEKLKKQLEAEGLFAIEKKRALPRLPRVVGVVTSVAGAALHDILRVSEGRCPVRIVVADCRVQGEDAPASIVAALGLVQRVADLDVVIVGRGGGSSEDLVAFQDEAVVRAIAACRVPIVSAVGHETDVTLADLVADVRAATPSNAAELVVPDKRLLVRELEAATRRLERAMDARIDGARMRLDRMERALGDPRTLLGAAYKRLDSLRARLEHTVPRRLKAERTRLVALERRLFDANPRHELARRRARLATLESKLERAMRAVLVANRAELDTSRTRLEARGPTLVDPARAKLLALAAKLDALSPLAVLTRGYAIVLAPDGTPLVDAAEVAIGDPIEIRLARGRVGARVERTEPSVDENDAKNGA